MTFAQQETLDHLEDDLMVPMQVEFAMDAVDIQHDVIVRWNGRNGTLASIVVHPDGQAFPLS